MEPARRPKTPAERQRELRARRRKDEILFRRPLPRELIRDALIEEGEIGEWDEQDDDLVQDALVRLILRTCHSVTGGGDDEC